MNKVCLKWKSVFCWVSFIIGHMPKSSPLVIYDPEKVTLHTKNLREKAKCFTNRFCAPRWRNNAKQTIRQNVRYSLYFPKSSVPWAYLSYRTRRTRKCKPKSKIPILQHVIPIWNLCATSFLIPTNFQRQIY